MNIQKGYSQGRYDPRPDQSIHMLLKNTLFQNIIIIYHYHSSLFRTIVVIYFYPLQDGEPKHIQNSGNNRNSEGEHKCTAWGVQRGRRQPQAGCLANGSPLKQPQGRFRSGSPAGRRKLSPGETLGSPWPPLATCPRIQEVTDKDKDANKSPRRPDIDVIVIVVTWCILLFHTVTVYTPLQSGYYLTYPEDLDEPLTGGCHD
jgi:hypothetical protein